MRRRPFVVAAALALLVPPAVARAEAPALASHFQDTVHVAATKLASRLAELATSASVVGRADVRAGTSRTLAGALATVPGAHLLDLTGSESYMLVESRGFASQGQSSHVLLLVDEVPVNEIEGDRVDWSLLAQPQIERVEFLRGPASFLYGNPSMAGVVNLVTRRGLGRTGWLEGGGGSEGRADVAGGASWSDPRTSGSVSGSFRNVEGFREHSGFRGASGLAAVRTGLSARWSARLHALAHDSDQDVPGPLADPEWRDEPERASTPTDRRALTTVAGGVELGGPLARTVELTVQGGAEARDLAATETIVPVGTLDRTSDSRALRAEARVRWRPEGAAGIEALAGGEVRHGALESRYHDPSAGGALVGAGDVERTSGGVFALGRARLHPRWTLHAGLRLDWLRSSVDDPTDSAPRSANDDLRAVSPTAALSFALPRSGNVYVSYARAFKAPALDQLYDRRPYVLDFDGPGGMPPFTLRISNSALEPQRGHHVDLGARAPVTDRLWLDGAFYWARSTNEIGFDLANFRYSSIDRSLHVGFEGQASWTIAAPLAAQLGYAWTRATFDGGPHDGRQINTVPEHQGHVRLVARSAALGALTAEVRHVRDQWLDEDERYPIEPYTVVDLGASRPVAGVEVFAAVRNLFDERYATLGYLTLDAFGNDLPLRFPASPRAFHAGLRLAVGGTD